MEKLVVVDKKVEVRCPQTGGEWVDTSIWEHLMVVAEGQPDQTRRFENFQEFYNFCAEDGLRNASAYLNWRKKPTVSVNNATQLTTLFLMERNFKWLEVRVQYIPRPDLTMDRLLKSLPAAEFAMLCEKNNWKIL